MSLEVFLCITGFLLLLCVLTNRASEHFGIPSLLLFLAFGMLAGKDGLGGIDFYDVKMANYIGTTALCFILFSGGLNAKWQHVKNVLSRGALLSTLGVILTAIFIFLFNLYVLKICYELSFLISVILSSTDAPAVFSILRLQKSKITNEVKSLIELESGSNDPMAVLLSMGAIAIFSQQHFSVSQAITRLVLQAFFGLLIGFLFGKFTGLILKKWRLKYQALYHIFGISIVLLTYSTTQLLSGNGFLAVYVCAIIIGNTAHIYHRQFIAFQDAFAWMMQICMFLILGLLVEPSQLKNVFGVALQISLFMMLVARPLAVFSCLYKSPFNAKEQFFISWAGLKGAVPIILATYPLLVNLENAQHLFNIIFFVVILSVLIQGKTIGFFTPKK